MKKMKFGTLCVHLGNIRTQLPARIRHQFYQTSTFVFDNAEEGAARFAGEAEGYTYARLVPNTPTHRVLVDKMAALEGGEAGQTFSSGMAAITAVALSLLSSGDHLLSTDVVYGCTYSLFSSLLTRCGIEVSFVDTTDLDQVRRHLKKNTRMVFLETPANPTMNVCDISAIADMARAVGAVSIVDNTFASSMFQRPLELGADVVLHSCTNYIGGHADLLGGVIIGSREFVNSMAPVVNDTGVTMGPHDAWLCIRGLKTLHLRMHKHASNAMMIARYQGGCPRTD